MSFYLARTSLLMSNFALLDCAALRRSDIALNNKKKKKN